MRFALGCCIAASVTLASAQQPPPHDHEPRFGGALFPAAGDTLHIEGVWSEQRRFKLFVSDPAGRLLPVDRLRAVRGRVLVGDRAFPLELQPGVAFLEARIPTMPIPAQFSVQVEVAPGGPEEGFELLFSDYSDERRARGEALPTVSPTTLPGILAAVRQDRRDGQWLLDRGELVTVSIPAERIRYRVLELEPYISRLRVSARPRAEAALLTAVRAVWLLHTATDYGNDVQIGAAFAALGLALDEVEAAFATGER